jgi:steroid delta-isomerase-like uncharacterized protein
MTSAEQRLDSMNAYVDAWQQRSAAAVCACFAPGGTYVNPAVPDGIEGNAIKEMVAASLAGFSDLRFEVVMALAAEPDCGVMQWIMHGTNDGPVAPGLEATGKKVALPGCNVFRFGPDGIVRCDVYFDQATFAAQLGLHG